MRLFEFVRLKDDRNAHGQRAETTTEYGVLAYDLLLLYHACASCRTQAQPQSRIPTRASYRSVGELVQGLPGLVDASRRVGEPLPPCTCGGALQLTAADYHAFCSTTGRDLVARMVPGASPQLFDWSISTGHQPLAPAPHLDGAVAHDAILRTLGALRDQDEDLASFRMVMEEALQRMAYEPELFRLAPYLMRHAPDLVDRMASAHMQAAPQSAKGYYWKGQLAVEALARSGAHPQALQEPLSLFRQALACQPNDPDSLIGLANVARLANDDPQAESALRALLQQQPNHPEGNYTLGLVLLPRNPTEALACFERGEAASPEDPDYPRSKAKALLALGRVPEARAAIARAQSLAPDDPRVAEVASQLAAQNPIAKYIKWGVGCFIAFVFLCVALAVVWIVVTSFL